MQILSCIFIIIGAFIGAGFASGREIYTFFFIYGKKGIIGIIISCFIIGAIIYKTLKIAKKYNINKYSKFLETITGMDTKYVQIINSIVNIFFLATFFIMCAGFATYFKQELNISKIYGSITIAILSYIILNKNTKGILILNWIIMPTIIIILILIGMTNINTYKIIEQSNNVIWIISSILYAGYNSITLITILITIKEKIKNKKDIIKIAILSSVIIIILAVVVFYLIAVINDNVEIIEMPAVYAVRKN